MRILFWNTANNAIGRYVGRAIHEHSVDIAVVSEFGGLNFNDIIASKNKPYRLVAIGGCDKVKFIVRQEEKAVVYQEQSRYSIVHVATSNSSLLVVGLHMQDNRNYDSMARARLGTKIMADTTDAISRSGCEDLIMIGDFNANPYSPEMLAPYSFNAALFKDIIKANPTCTFEHVEYWRLYNPVLNFISEESRLYGSYYLMNSREPGPIWNCLDQALFSRSLVDRIVRFEYLRTVDGESLMAKVKPKSSISDHLPLLVEISDEGILA